MRIHQEPRDLPEKEKNVRQPKHYGHQLAFNFASRLCLGWNIFSNRAGVANNDTLLDCCGAHRFATLLTLVVWSILGRKLWLSSRQAWGSLIIVGIASSALPFMLLSWGLQYVTSGFAGVSMAAVALLVLPLSHFLVAGERMTLRKTLGLTVGFCGVVILIGGNAFTSTGSELETLGRLACLGAAACYAVSSIVMRRLPAVDPIGLAAVPLVFGSLIVIPVAYASEGLA